MKTPFVLFRFRTTNEGRLFTLLRINDYEVFFFISPAFRLKGAKFPFSVLTLFNDLIVKEFS